MEPLTHALTHLALDPFDCARLDETSSLSLGGFVVSRAELESALTSGSPAGVAGHDFQTCVTCSDPGYDEHDPWHPPPKSTAQP